VKQKIKRDFIDVHNVHNSEILFYANIGTQNNVKLKRSYVITELICK